MSCAGFAAELGRRQKPEGTGAGKLTLLPNDLILFTPAECDLPQGFRAEGKPA
jgi:hypothetical protein